LDEIETNDEYYCLRREAIDSITSYIKEGMSHYDRSTSQAEMAMTVNIFQTDLITEYG
jgi:hypothetical protein